MRSFLSILTLCSFQILLISALKIPFQTRNTSITHLSSIDLPRQSSSNNTLLVGNTQNAFYYANIALGGQTISVMIDTGSSDLWVAAESISGATDLGKSITLSYAVGNAAGDIYAATLDFAGYTVQDQAFVLVTNTSSFSTNINAEGFNGLIGLGPNTGSVISQKIDGSAGDSALDRIFQQNISSDNYITLMLSRENDPGSQITGQFTIAEVLSEYSSITSMPQIPVELTYELTDEDQHWQVLTDSNGVIGPDGQPIQVDSIVPSAPNGQLVAVLDSGYTLPQVPRSMSDDIYGRVQGAEWSDTYQVWLVPCGQLINLTFYFGGNAYPIHPLDVSSSDFDVTFSNGDPACLGTFQPITSGFSLLGEYDMILGMAFLRNAYTLINFGNLVDGASSSNSPYVQLLSLTNVTEAVEDFIQVRLGGQNLINSSQYALLPSSEEQHSPESTEEEEEQYEEDILSRWPYILVGCLVFIILLVVLGIWCCCRRRKRARLAKQNAILGSGPKKAYGQLPDSGSTVSLALDDMRKSTYDLESEYGRDV